MILKREIVSELGGADLLAPEAIARSLAANDQIKYYFALLQTARANADRPSVPPPDLRAERVGSKIQDTFLDDVVAGTAKAPNGGYRLPHGSEILDRIKAGMAEMLACLPADERRAFEARLVLIKPAKVTKGVIAGDQIDAMTSGSRDSGDSLHLVVMDAHRAINRQQAAMATETLAGAHVYGLSSRSRRLVSAFMQGLNRTAPLKFNHPGLGTTATEHDGRLLIQNDIGTTDAHVLIVRVEDNTVTVIYSDIHRPRLKFLLSLFADFDVQWDGMDTRSSSKLESGSYLLATGTYSGDGLDEVERFLDHLGSRLVFLIDWNRMRKRLHGFVGKDDAVEILKWAAENDYGHRGLLEIGGERALADAVEYAAGERLRYGDRLDDLIGAANAREFLCQAMKAASSGLISRRSRRAVLDEIKADLRRYFDKAGLAIFDIAARHAACGYDIAVTMREAIERSESGDGSDWTSKLATRAVVWEARADQLLNDARDDIKRFNRPASLANFLNYADDAVDELEEAASISDLLPLVAAEHIAASELKQLSDLALGSSQEFIKCIECAATITRADVRDDLDDFLQSLERLVALEHQADDQIRLLRRALVTSDMDHKTFFLLHQLSRALETATDAYAHAGQALRGYLMEEVIA
jgi:uncharacterized protein Yka (UPF0111/DUF47 family)